MKADEELQKQINVMQSGILSIQGKNFREDCRILLAPEKEFTLKEFENLQQEHAIYKALGGNHEGDTLFDLVTKKATNILTDEK